MARFWLLPYLWTHCWRFHWKYYCLPAYDQLTRRCSLSTLTADPTGFCLPFASTVPGVVYGVFQMMFASITPLLQTGAIAGRMKFSVYFVYIIFWELLVYYPLAHWIWGGGWLSPLVRSHWFLGVNFCRVPLLMVLVSSISLEVSSFTFPLVQPPSLPPKVSYHSWCV